MNYEVALEIAMDMLALATSVHKSAALEDLKSKVVAELARSIAEDGLLEDEIETARVYSAVEVDLCSHCGAVLRLSGNVWESCTCPEAFGSDRDDARMSREW